MGDCLASYAARMSVGCIHPQTKGKGAGLAELIEAIDSYRAAGHGPSVFEENNIDCMRKGLEGPSRFSYIFVTIFSYILVTICLFNFQELPNALDIRECKRMGVDPPPPRCLSCFL